MLRVLRRVLINPELPHSFQEGKGEPLPFHLHEGCENNQKDKETSYDKYRPSALKMRRIPASHSKIHSHNTGRSMCQSSTKTLQKKGQSRRHRPTNQQCRVSGRLPRIGTTIIHACVGVNFVRPAQTKKSAVSNVFFIYTFGGLEARYGRPVKLHLHPAAIRVPAIERGHPHTLRMNAFVRLKQGCLGKEKQQN